MNGLFAAIINGGIAGVGLTCAVCFALWLLPRRALNAATRYAIWWITLAAVVVLPSFYLPHAQAPERPLPVNSIAAPIAHAIDIPAQSSSVTVMQTAPSASDRLPRFPLQMTAGAWPARIFALWGVASILLLLRLCASYLFLERRKRRARPADNLRHWTVRTFVSDEISSPMAAGLFRPAILLPARLLSELDAEELEQIRVHETAHLLRRDDVALLLQRTIEACFALHPAVRWITRRIDLEREIACDDFVIEQTGQARPYASCLTRVVEIAGGVRSSLVAAAATEERSHLARRIEMLLDQKRNKGTRLLKLRLLLVAGILGVLACVAGGAPGVVALASEPEPIEPVAEQTPVPPAPPVAPAAPSAPQSHSNRTISTRTSDGLHSRETRIQGDVSFTDDDSDVKAISGNGSFVYEESYGFTRRRYEVTTNSSGQLERRYFVDGHPKPLDADGKAWLRDGLPDVLRETGINAPERVQRILNQGGARAVIDEIGKIHSDGTRSLYIRELMARSSLNTDQLESLLRLVRGMNSDGEKAGVLVSLAPLTLKDGLRDYSFEALLTIHSDGEKHRVLRQYIAQDTSRGTLILVARAAEGINSDGEKASLLADLAGHLRGNADVLSPFFRATQSIHSDGEHARVLMAAIAAAGEQHDILVDALRSAVSLNSDGEKASVLVHADGYWKDDDAMRQAYFDAARSIHSDGEKARVLTSLIGGSGFSDRTLTDAVHCAASINSDGEKARTLIAVANHSAGKTAVREEIRIAAASIHSDGEYRRVMTAIGSPVSSVPNRAQAR